MVGLEGYLLCHLVFFHVPCSSSGPAACAAFPAAGYLGVFQSWVAGAVTLLPFPYLRVGVLLAYGVSGVCGLRRRSRLPFVVRHPFSVSIVLHLFWGWGGLVTGLWPLLRLLGFGLF